MIINEARDLLDSFALLPMTPAPEPTIFSVGGRGYYENPTTDMLAFFLNPDAAHNFEKSIIQAFFDCLNIENVPQSLTLVNAPLRELSVDGGRIDLLLEGDDWVAVIENKIFHTFENPFDNYMSYASWRFPGKNNKYFIVISPDGLIPKDQPGWIGVSYPALIERFKNVIASVFINRQPDKWMFFFRDFIVNLEQVVESTQKVSEESLKFFLDNLSILDRVVGEKNRAMQVLQGDLYVSLVRRFPGKDISYKLETWYGFPALRFHFKDMGDKSTVVLFLDGRGGKKSYGIYFYVCDIKSDKQRKNADKAMESFLDISKILDEQNKTIRGYCRYLPDTEIVTMEKMLAEVLERLDYFEREIRPHW